MWIDFWLRSSIVGVVLFRHDYLINAIHIAIQMYRPLAWWASAVVCVDTFGTFPLLHGFLSTVKFMLRWNDHNKQATKPTKPKIFN